MQRQTDRVEARGVVAAAAGLKQIEVVSLLWHRERAQRSSGLTCSHVGATSGRI